MLSRLKFEIKTIVNEMLDQIPEEQFVSSTTTFFDPEIGGGQFLKEIEIRLRKYGHSDTNIKSRVSGMALNILSKNYAINMNKVISNIEIGDFLQKDTNMKFDNIVGNPPFQDGTKIGQQNKIYNQISKKALSLLADTGVMSFITPTSVCKKSKRFSLIGLPGLKNVNFNAGNYFNVGINICSWSIDKNYKGNIKIIHANGTGYRSPGLPIYDMSKIDKNFSNIYDSLKQLTDHPSKRMFKQNNFGPALSKNKSKSHPYTMYKIDNGVPLRTCYSSRLPYSKGDRKFIISRTKVFNEAATIIDSKDYDTAQMFIAVDSDREIKNIKSFLFSEYFIEHSNKWKKLDGYGFNDCLKHIPPFDKTKHWTNDEVREFIESFVK